MNKLPMLTIILMLLAACAMPQGGMVAKKRSSGGLFAPISKPLVQEAQTFVDESFDVVTEPAGARIMVNNSSYGNSPVHVTVRRLWRGDPNYPMTLDTVKVEAFPVEAGQCVQTGIYGDRATKTPPVVKFNMTSCAAK